MSTTDPCSTCTDHEACGSGFGCVTDVIREARLFALRDGEAYYIQRAAESQEVTSRTIHLIIADCFRVRAENEATR